MGTRLNKVRTDLTQDLIAGGRVNLPYGTLDMDPNDRIEAIKLRVRGVLVCGTTAGPVVPPARRFLRITEPLISLTMDSILRQIGLTDSAGNQIVQSDMSAWEVMTAFRACGGRVLTGIPNLGFVPCRRVIIGGNPQDVVDWDVTLSIPLSIEQRFLGNLHAPYRRDMESGSLTINVGTLNPFMAGAMTEGYVDTATGIRPTIDSAITGEDIELRALTGRPTLTVYHLTRPVPYVANSPIQVCRHDLVGMDNHLLPPGLYYGLSAALDPQADYMAVDYIIGGDRRVERDNQDLAALRDRLYDLNGREETDVYQAAGKNDMGGDPGLLFAPILFTPTDGSPNQLAVQPEPENLRLRLVGAGWGAPGGVHSVCSIRVRPTARVRPSLVDAPVVYPAHAEEVDLSALAPYLPRKV